MRKVCVLIRHRGGELAIALRAQVPGQNIALHGNNKSYDEIKRAIKHGVGRVVVDSIDELKLITDVYAELCAESVAEGLEPYPAVPCSSGLRPVCTPPPTNLCHGA